MPFNKDTIERFVKAAKELDFITTKDAKKLFDALVSSVQQTKRDLTAKIEARLAEIRQPADGKDGRDGKNGERGPKGDKGDKGDTGPVGRALFAPKGDTGAPGKDGSPDTPTQVRDKLETLEGDERLRMEAIQGLEALIDDIKNLKARPTSIGGAKGFTLYINGVKKLLTAQTLNITGTGVSYNFANGRNDVTISGGGGSLAVLTATGAMDDSNTSFTFASEPTLVNINGATYVHGHGVTISGTNVTTDNPVGTGGFIYGLG